MLISVSADLVRLSVVEAGVNFLVKRFGQATILHSAVHSKKANVVSYVLNLVREKYPDKFWKLVNEKKEKRIDGDTALQDAIHGGQVEIARVLGAVCDLTSSVSVDREGTIAKPRVCYLPQSIGYACLPIGIPIF